MRTVYICGAKGISQYGGFESFVQNLIEAHKDIPEIQYHITCKANGQGSMDVSKLSGASAVVDGVFTYCNAQCHLIDVAENIGSAQAVFYDVKSLEFVCHHIESNHIQNPIVYILACRVGPFVKKYVDFIHRHNGKVLLNPDGHEWKRRKWSWLVRKYWKISEARMVKFADRIICDSKHIEEYITDTYSKYKPVTTYISYGADLEPSKIADDDGNFVNWLKTVDVEPGQYYLVVGRFVEENNFDLIMKEFMKTSTDKKLVLITTFNEKLKNRLKKELDYKKDKRIVLVAPTYDVELLKKIREQAYAYIHGHEVGGTNPSLLEGLASTKLNLVLGVGFNREVAGDAALFWEKKEGSLSQLITVVDNMSSENRNNYRVSAKGMIQKRYSWNQVSLKYYSEFMK